MRNSQLIVEQGEEEVSIPIEDLGAIVLGSSPVTLSIPLLRGLSQNGTALIVCDEKYTPCGIFLPLLQHSRGVKVILKQTELGAVFLKRCWKRIVEQKISNQAELLKRLQKPNGVRLLALASDVSSGDRNNVEAQAARTYWTSLFSAPFKRSADTEMNGALNYGYSIIRSALARALVGRGLLPAMGVHHCSELNQFNLADDFIEPFRPMVDMKVYELFLSSERELDRGTRNSLISILHEQVVMKGESVSILRAMDICASSYVEAIFENNADKIILPEFVL